MKPLYTLDDNGITHFTKQTSEDVIMAIVELQEKVSQLELQAKTNKKEFEMLWESNKDLKKENQFLKVEIQKESKDDKKKKA